MCFNQYGLYGVNGVINYDALTNPVDIPRYTSFYLNHAGLLVQNADTKILIGQQDDGTLMSISANKLKENSLETEIVNIFRVTQDGNLAIKGRVEAESGYFHGEIQAKEGSIGQWKITQEGLQQTSYDGVNNKFKIDVGLDPKTGLRLSLIDTTKEFSLSNAFLESRYDIDGRIGFYIQNADSGMYLGGTSNDMGIRFYGKYEDQGRKYHMLRENSLNGRAYLGVSYGGDETLKPYTGYLVG
jgi:hypothetical protein